MLILSRLLQLMAFQCRVRCNSHFFRNHFRDQQSQHQVTVQFVFLLISDFFVTLSKVVSALGFLLRNKAVLLFRPSASSLYFRVGVRSLGWPLIRWKTALYLYFPRWFSNYGELNLLFNSLCFSFQIIGLRPSSAVKGSVCALASSDWNYCSVLYILIPIHLRHDLPGVAVPMPSWILV